MPSVYELAKICEASYDDHPHVDGWELVQPTYDFFSTKGFFAALLKKGDEYVVVFRGTDAITGDVKSDIQLTLGITPDQYKSAERTLNSVLYKLQLKSRNKLTLTGHSLGGGLAALLSSRKNYPVVTFNAPGMRRTALASDRNILFTSVFSSTISNITNYIKNKNGIRTYMDSYRNVLHIRSEWDIVSIGAGPKIVKNSITLENKSCETDYSLLSITRAKRAALRTLCAHEISKLANVLASITELNDEIQWYE